MGNGGSDGQGVLPDADQLEGTEQRGLELTLTATGVTLLGVILSIGVTVGFGIGGPWWVGLLAAVASTVALVGLVKVATRAGRGPLARLARWIISAPPMP